MPSERAADKNQNKILNLQPVACSGNCEGICLIPEGNCPGTVEGQPGIPAWRQLSRGSAEERARAAATADALGKDEGRPWRHFLRENTLGARGCFVWAPPAQCTRPLAEGRSGVLAALLRFFPGITPRNSCNYLTAGRPSALAARGQCRTAKSAGSGAGSSHAKSLRPPLSPSLSAFPQTSPQCLPSVPSLSASPPSFPQCLPSVFPSGQPLNSSTTRDSRDSRRILPCPRLSPC